MTIPSWLKPGFIGALFGALVVGIAGFTVGGWVTAADASKMAATMAEDKVMAALLPICVEQSRNDPERVAKLATVKAAETYKRRETVMKTGWATLPGSTTPNGDLAHVCFAALQAEPA